MEVYIPYIIGSSVSALIGKVALSYYYTDIKSTDETVVKSSESILYNLVDERLKERVLPFSLSLTLWLTVL